MSPEHNPLLGIVSTALRKPRVALNPLFSTHPVKNYIYHLLAQHIKELGPQSLLDAGCGDLRCLRHFPANYVGITREASFYFSGLERPENQEWITAHGQPRAYLTLFENDFSSIGAFDLCVCMNALQFNAYENGVLARLFDRINLGGSYIMNNSVEYLPGYLDMARRHFAAVEVIYCGTERTDLFESNPQKSYALAIEEMNAPNRPDGHLFFYLIATGKKSPPAKPSSATHVHVRGNLYTILPGSSVMAGSMPQSDT